MGPEEDTWPLPPAEVLGDSPVCDFILGFYRVSPAFLPGGYMAELQWKGNLERAGGS